MLCGVKNSLFSWYQSLTLSILKKDTSDDCGKRRGTSLIPRILVLIVVLHLTPNHKSNDRKHQAGFRPEWHCVEQISVFSQLLEARLLSHRTLHCSQTGSQLRIRELGNTSQCSPPKCYARNFHKHPKSIVPMHIPAHNGDERCSPRNSTSSSQFNFVIEEITEYD